MSEDVGCNRTEKSHARDLRETSDEDVRGAVMALEMSVGELAECGAGTIRALSFVLLHPLAPGLDRRRTGFVAHCSPFGIAMMGSTPARVAASMHECFA